MIVHAAVIAVADLFALYECAVHRTFIFEGANSVHQTTGEANAGYSQHSAKAAQVGSQASGDSSALVLTL
jgi:hypothetical protein